MSMDEPDRPGADDLVIEFPTDPDVLELPDAEEVYVSVQTVDPPDTHSIRERWARLAEIGGGG